MGALGLFLITPSISFAAAPSAPSQLRSTALSEDRVRLRWQDNSCNESAYILQILGTEGWRNVPFALEADTSAVILSGLEPSTAYQFRLMAANGDGISPPSSPTKVRTFAQSATCAVSTHRLCLLDGRFAVTATFEASHFTGARFAARAVPDGSRTGSFWFFDANNLELSVEITDGSAINGHFWVSVGGLSNLEYRIHVADTLTGESKVYVNPTSTLCGLDDREAFAAPLGQTSPIAKVAEITDAATTDISTLHIWPEAEQHIFRPSWNPSKASCGLENPADLRLLGGRFELSLDWRDEDGTVLSAVPRYDSDNSGFFTVDEPDLADWAVKVLDGRFFNRHFWLFWAPLSGREAWLRVKDTQTGEVRRFYTARASSCGSADTSAFGGGPDTGL